MKRKKAPGELELQILHLLQKKGSATVSDIEKELKGTYAYTTIMTVLTRMFSKKLVTREKEGRQYLYSPVEKRSNSLLQRIKKRLFGNKTAGMIQYLIESSEPMSKKELEEIEELIKRCKK